MTQADGHAGLHTAWTSYLGLLYRLSLFFWFIGTSGSNRGPLTGGEGESALPAHLHHRDKMAAPDDSWGRCACFWTKFFVCEAWVGNQNNRNGRVVSARAFLKLYFQDIVDIDYINPVQVWQRVLHEEKEEGMLEMVGGEWICERRTAFPFLIMGSERSLPLPAFSIHPR